MSWLRRVKNSIRSTRVDDDIDREIAFHLAERSDELQAEGLTPAESARRARVQFGNPRLQAERTRDMDLTAIGLFDDLRFAVRALVRARAFSLTAVATLGAAAGITAAILAIVHGIIVRPLPFHAPGRLVAVWPQRLQSNIDLLLLREHGRAFSGVAAVSPGWTMGLTGAGEPAKLTFERVTGNFFQTLGTAPLAGRVIREEDARPGAPEVVVLSHRGWQRYFGGDPSVIGRTVRLDGAAFEVIGIMPKQFEVLGLRADGYTAFPIDPNAWYHQIAFGMLIARLGDGTTLEQASSEYAALIPRIRQLRGYSAEYGRTASLEPLHTATVGDVSSALLLLAGAVALTLLLAAANVASLQLTRTAGRRRELAVRVSLGASRLRLARRLAAESLVVATAAAAVGVVMAYLALPALVAMLPADTPRVGDIAIDVPLAAAVLAATALVSLLLGFAPALAATRATGEAALRSANSSEAPRAKRLRGAMVSAEIALAVMLAIGAGLMLQTLRNLHRVDTGFDANGVLAMHLSPNAQKYGRSSIASLYEQLLARIREVPGVTAAGAIQHLPFSTYAWNGSLDIEGFTPPPGTARPVAGLRIATPGYFEALGQRILTGRGFETADAESGTTVVINAAFARRYFESEQRALGRTLRLNGPRGAGPWMTVAGIVADVRHTSLTTPPVPEIYTSIGKQTIPAMMLAVRTSGDPLALVPAVRSAIWSIDREMPIADVETMEAKIGGSVGRPRLLTSLLVSFAALGFLLAIVGVFSVVAYSVTQRRREIGIMVALGAERRRIALAVVMEGARYAAIGLLVGVPGAIAASRYLETLVFGVTPADPATYVAAAMVTLAVVCAACIWPALRAARVDPALTIREA